MNKTEVDSNKHEPKEGREVKYEGAEDYAKIMSRPCKIDPCLVKEMETMLVSILQTYSNRLKNREIGFNMYSDTVKLIYRPRLWKRNCVKRIHNVSISSLQLWHLITSILGSLK